MNACPIWHDPRSHANDIVSKTSIRLPQASVTWWTRGVPSSGCSRGGRGWRASRCAGLARPPRRSAPAAPAAPGPATATGAAQQLCIAVRWIFITVTWFPSPSVALSVCLSRPPIQQQPRSAAGPGPQQGHSFSRYRTPPMTARPHTFLPLTGCTLRRRSTTHSRSTGRRHCFPNPQASRKPQTVLCMSRAMQAVLLGGLQRHIPGARHPGDSQHGAGGGCAGHEGARHRPRPQLPLPQPAAARRAAGARFRVQG